MGFIKALFIFCFVFVLNEPFQNEEAILWDKSRKLTWEDFKGAPENTRAAAVTASGLTYEFSTTKKNNQVVDIDFTVSSHFYPSKSWYRPEVCDTVILGHEQLHFDITEVYARKFIKLLKAKKFSNNVKNEVKQIYNTINSELNDFQNLYDSETNFSRNREAQLAWELKVKKLLE